MVKRKRAELVAAKKRPRREARAAATNPFEVQVNRKKHDVLGQKSKSDRGLPGVARSKAMEKRKKTLLREYQQRHKSNRFVDRRFGEYDVGLSPEEKLMQRFVLERKKRQDRSGRFNLEGEEEEELTHYGRSLGEVGHFDDIQLSDEEMANDDIGETHFGGFLKRKNAASAGDQGTEDRPRSRKLVMEELVAKSKAMKYERQAVRHSVEDLLDRVDTDWRDVRASLTKASNLEEERLEGDAYDKVVRELTFEKRGRPLDRMKTEEEMAQEERERLEQLEADRIRRSKGLAVQEGTLTGEHLSADCISEKPTRKKDTRFVLRYKDGKIVLPEGQTLERRAVQHVDVCGGEGGDRGGTAEEEEEDEEEEEEQEEEVESEEEEWKEEEEEVEIEEEEWKEEEEEVEKSGCDYASDLESEDPPVDSPSPEATEGGQSQCPTDQPTDNEDGMEVRLRAAAELPYTLPVPRSLREFCTVVQNRSPEECVTAVERIHSYNHQTLAPTNKPKLELFFGVLVDYSLQLGQRPTREALQTLDRLARPLFALAQLNPLHTAVVMRERLEKVFEQWRRAKSSVYPPFSDLLIFKLISLLFPTSDYQHPVVTPAMLFMGQLLLKCRVASLEDAARGLLVCQSLVEYVAQSNRFVPEVVNYVASILGCCSNSKDCMVYPPFLRNEKLHVDCKMTQGVHIPSVVSVVGGGGALSAGVVLKAALHLALRLMELYTALPSFPEIFVATATNIKCISEGLPSPVKELCSAAVATFGEKSTTPRPVLQLLKQKPKSIKFYEPKFDEMYAVGRRKAGSRAAGEKQKLVYKVKRERKGAIREIRKDNLFLAKERLRETLERDAQRKKKTRQLYHDLQMERHEEKVLKRKK